MKNGQKVIELKAFVLLPENFKGKVPEALEVTANLWRDSIKKKTHATVKKPKGIDGIKGGQILWDLFLDAVERNGLYIGTFEISKYNKKENRFV